MYEINEHAALRLIDVLNHKRISKVNDEELYRERVGCVAANIKKLKSLDEKSFRLHIVF